MSKARSGCLPAGIAISAHSADVSTEAGAGAWMLLLPAGRTVGRDGRGPYIAGDVEAMQAIVDRTKARAGATQLMVDYDHQSQYGAVPGVGGRAPAAGWIVDYKVDEQGIHGRVEWTAAAARAVRSRQYRYLSPVFQHDQANGAIHALVSAGLVNSPNFDLAAAAAGAQHHDGETMKDIAKALGLAETAGEADILTAIHAVQAERATIAKALGLGAAAASTEIITAAQSAVGHAEAAPDPTRFVPIEQVTAMQAQLTAITTERAAEKAEEAVGAAIADGKLSPALKDWGLSVHRADPAQFAAFVAKAPVLTAPQRDLGKRPSAEPTLGDADLAVMRALGQDEAAFLAARKRETA